ncbi:DUF4488 domain-containing protein [uncultured Proteiniphilum sp.]|uniref:DUF4488 domain-containing protein n=1 Tax=uncultured Proteiniphilum sp. TaxID=497637 RepID=UPI0026068E80|nr:DUF4488 domain-containing protein [uncultured Proteiniphilum sp.]
MKTIILNFVICLIIGSGLTVNAQNPEQDVKNSPLAGLWIFERILVDNNGNKVTVYPGTFMMIDPDGRFTFFIYSPQGGFIVNEGTITLESDSVYAEMIDYNANSFYMGKTLKHTYKIEDKRLYKTLLSETDDGKQETEIWRRVERPTTF